MVNHSQHRGSAPESRVLTILRNSRLKSDSCSDPGTNTFGKGSILTGL